MARRRSTTSSDWPAIPPHLYWGIPKRAHRAFGTGDVRTSRAAAKHCRWLRELHAASFTPSSVREAAQHDRGYLAWLVSGDVAELIAEPGQ